MLLFSRSRHVACPCCPRGPNVAILSRVHSYPEAGAFHSQDWVTADGVCEEKQWDCPIYPILAKPGSSGAKFVVDNCFEWNPRRGMTTTTKQSRTDSRLNEQRVDRNEPLVTESEQHTDISDVNAHAKCNSNRSGYNTHVMGTMSLPQSGSYPHPWTAEGRRFSCGRTCVACMHARHFTISLFPLRRPDRSFSWPAPVLPRARQR